MLVPTWELLVSFPLLHPPQFPPLHFILPLPVQAQPALSVEAGMSGEAAESKDLACVGSGSCSQHGLSLQGTPVPTGFSPYPQAPRSSVNFPPIHDEDGCIFMGRRQISTEVLLDEIPMGWEVAESALLSFPQMGDEAIVKDVRSPAPSVGQSSLSRVGNLSDNQGRI